MTDTPCITIDYRERDSQIPELLRSRGHQVREEKLRVGDFVIGKLAIERKTRRDLQLSIIDGRLFRQIYAMRQLYSLCLLIIEDEPDGEPDNLHPLAILGALIKVTVAWQVPSLISRGVDQTISILELLLQQEMTSTDRASYKTRWGYKPHKPERRSRYILEGIKGIGPNRASSLLEHFGSLRNIFTASIADLSRVPGISLTLATQIDEICRAGYHSESNV